MIFIYMNNFLNDVSLVYLTAETPEGIPYKDILIVNPIKRENKMRISLRLDDKNLTGLLNTFIESGFIVKEEIIQKNKINFI